MLFDKDFLSENYVQNSKINSFSDSKTYSFVYKQRPLIYFSSSAKPIQKISSRSEYVHTTPNFPRGIAWGHLQSVQSNLDSRSISETCLDRQRHLPRSSPLVLIEFLPLPRSNRGSMLWQLFQQCSPTVCETMAFPLETNVWVIFCHISKC
jgi:hypothetical protein